MTSDQIRLPAPAAGGGGICGRFRPADRLRAQVGGLGRGAGRAQDAPGAATGVVALAGGGATADMINPVPSTPAPAAEAKSQAVAGLAGGGRGSASGELPPGDSGLGGSRPYMSQPSRMRPCGWVRAWTSREGVDVDVGVDLGGFEPGVAEHFLDVADVGAAAVHVGGAASGGTDGRSRVCRCRSACRRPLTQVPR